MFSSLASGHSKEHGTFGRFIYSLSLNCCCFCRVFFSALDSSVYEISVISSIIFATASGSSSPSFLLGKEGEKYSCISLLSGVKGFSYLLYRLKVSQPDVTFLRTSCDL